MQYFDFKQFRIYHDRCAMKVGTDGVLLGAWAEIRPGKRVLDIGCGTGLISLMAAQRGAEHCTGIEIDAIAAEQAAENAQASRFSERIDIRHEDILAHQPTTLYDNIISNPPFYLETTYSPDDRRATARHASGLTYEVLIVSAARLLLPGGLFQVIIPASAANGFHALCAMNALSLCHRTDVFTKASLAAKRVLLCFRKDPLIRGNVSLVSRESTPGHALGTNCSMPSPVACHADSHESMGHLTRWEHPVLRDTLVLLDGNGQKTVAYTQLTSDFYLDKG